MNREKKNKASVILGSASLVILIGSQYLNDILNIYIGHDRGFFTPIIALALVFGTTSIFLNRRIKVNKIAGFLYLVLISAFILTNILQSGKSTLTLVDFIGMCLIPIFLGAFLIVDYEVVFRGCMILLVLAIPVFRQLFLKANIGLNYDAVSMSTSYDILPITVAGLVHFLYFSKESKIVDKIMHVVSFIFSLALIRMSYRGALLALVVSLVVAFYFQKKRNSLRNQVLVITISVMIIVVLFNYQYVLQWVSEILNRFGVRIAFIDKSIYLLTHDTTANGRLDIYEKAFQGFLSSPVWGNGMATFQYYTEYPFPHNFILEFLFDGGLILFLSLMYVFAVSFKRLFKRAWEPKRYRFALILMIGSIAITRGLISAECWRIVLLWLFIGLALNNTETDEHINEK